MSDGLGGILDVVHDLAALTSGKLYRTMCV